jgi:hypothetical protein
VIGGQTLRIILAPRRSNYGERDFHLHHGLEYPRQQERCPRGNDRHKYFGNLI